MYIYIISMVNTVQNCMIACILICHRRHSRFFVVTQNVMLYLCITVIFIEIFLKINTKFSPF